MPAVALNAAAALLPVLVFLAILFLMDSFKLVPVRAVLVSVGAGALSAIAALGIEVWLMSASGISDWAFPRFVSPVIEEVLKAIYVVIVLRRRRLGFLVDAAVIGFAVGTGFALVENPIYLRRYPDSRLVLSLVRGFGPAILHGALTGLFAMLAKSLTDRHPERRVVMLLPGVGAAIVLHSIFNHFALPPILATCVLLVLLPIVMTVVFDRSERATREWVGDGLDLDLDLLNLITSPAFYHTRFGKYLKELRDRFDGAAVSDMFCLLQLELELSIRAKGMLLAREAGLDVPPDPAVKPKLEELKYLQESIGPTGMLALKPLRVASDRDDWHAYLLEQAGMESRGHRWVRRVRKILKRGRE
jgi:RsiW-degrading membrane proteinase PrsW (M82 family)